MIRSQQGVPSTDAIQTGFCGVETQGPRVLQEMPGHLSYYDIFVRFSQDEISEWAILDVVNEYLFKAMMFSDDILGRFLHQIIYLRCTMELNQHLLVAEALVASCMHDDWPHTFPIPHWNLAQSRTKSTFKSILEIINDLYCDPVIKNDVQTLDLLNKISNGLLAQMRGA
ncbi:hypothetical protein PAAG_05558 [Paracoccidioides lutzii Pb01]|uniref:Uncharacterized protein n=1 Tax=Paracoccidioides lutzii (strain ATCC MYA-826 / Pb01) TaxID=502779 RepID=C1H465_PARBA|nr:hypothetical protein PAAG_05558 [Paracoccidioides lutzii Pb01]EEH34509.2 hypothetical protein PAAG_05558 [Paracoccidioides lutzii Pb01]